MLFGRGQWAIVGLDVNSFPAFQATLNDPKKIFLASQLTATIRSRFNNCTTVGINPFDKPRKDEHELSNIAVADINDYLELLKAMGPDTPSVFDPLLYGKNYGGSEDEFVLNANMFNTYGLWVVFNGYD